MDKRLIYRVALKILFSVALIILLIVFVKSLFTVPESQTDRVASEPMPVVTLDLQGILKGDVRKIRWQGKDVAILKRADDYAFRPTKYIPKIPHPSLNGNARSLTKAYFVYYNYGDSGHCPLFKETNTLKDTCTGIKFDMAGKEIGKGLQGHRLEIPPHYFDDKLGGKLIIGRWEKE